jgi:hypothetical protein
MDVTTGYDLVVINRFGEGQRRARWHKVEGLIICTWLSIVFSTE